MATVINNIVNHEKEIVTTLGVQRQEFLQCFSYESKSVFCRKRSILKFDDVNNYLKEYSNDSANDIMDDIMAQEKYIDAFIMAIDSFLFFGNSTYEIIKKIIELIFYSELFCEDKIEHNSEETDRKYILNNMAFYPNSEYAKVISQHWFVIDFENNKGISYQWQYIKYFKKAESNELLEANIAMFNTVKKNGKRAFIAMTSLGAIRLNSHLNDIYNKLKLCFGYGENEKGTLPEIHLPSTARLPRHFGEITDRDFLDIFRRKKDPALSSDFGEFAIGINNTNEKDTWSPLQIEIQDIESLFEFHIKKHQLEQEKDSVYLILFVSGILEMQQWCQNMESAIFKQTVFAYQDTNIPHNICFTNGNSTYKKAIILNK
jgi:hypothetical protein